MKKRFSANKKMDIKADITKLTSIRSANNIKTDFLPINGLGRAEQDREMNNHPVRIRNGNGRSLYEIEQDDCQNNYEYTESTLDNIRMSVRLVNPQVYSNEHIEEHVRERQIETSLKQVHLSETPNIDDDANVKRLLKNGVVRGLVNQGMISKSDLTCDTSENMVEDLASKDDKKKTYSPKCLLVQDEEDPDLFVHPLAGKIDYVGDWVLDRIGTKKTMTPKIYQQNVDDSDFEFKKSK